MSTFYSTPANVQDFKKPESYKTWSKTMHDWNIGAFDAQQRKLPDGHPQFWVELDHPPTALPVVKPIAWKAFPKYFTQFPEPKEKYGDAENRRPTPEDTRKPRRQDEYFEWFVHYNSSGKMIRIDFTCEGPEYFESLFELEEDVCVDLYRKYVNPSVTAEELKGSDGYYSKYNKWNTTHGAMHLNNGANTLGAEIYLAAHSTILRKNKFGPVTEPEKLVGCGRLGVELRFSDPHIASEVNTLCNQGLRVGLKNPVGIYISKPNLAGLVAPDGKNHMKLLRGIEGTEETKEYGLRYSFDVSNETFTINDCTLGGKQIYFAGQIVEECFEVFLEGIAEQAPHGKQKMLPCINVRHDHYIPPSESINESRSIATKAEPTPTRRSRETPNQS
jgi:hypothetical protein